ncbi:MAG TPA: dienelactone hydrolase family protein [Aggregatilineales bacterium]|nr:dienelactone hydrolase family protein [Aggregatilineales bacterium]
MCYDSQAQPPLPPGETSPARGEDIILIASDGNRLAAYAAHPSRPSGASVLIYPDVRGLHQFYKDLALRFGEVGITALAIDYFGRTAGLTPRDESFDYKPHVLQLRLDSFKRDVAAGLAWLRDASKTPIFVVGFCMGGSLTLITGTHRDFAFAGLIPFYAGMSRDFGGAGTVLDFADHVAFPVLGLFGGADQGIPENAVKQLDEELDGAGVEHNLIIYPGAPHSFFDRFATDYAPASADAWARVLDFIGRHRGSVAN